MCWLPMTAALVFLTGPAQAQENEAEKLYRGMEKKILAAKTLQIEVEGQLVFPQGKGTLKGKVLFAQGNRCRIEVLVEHNGMKQTGSVVSDGKSIVTKDNDRVRTIAVKEGDQDLWRGCLARAGAIALAVFIAEARPGNAPPKEALDLDKAVAIKDFKLGAKEKVGATEAQVIEWAAKLASESVWTKMSVWVDLKTQLPLKRVIEATQRGETKRVVENYTTFSLDPSLDAKLFELTK
jgi:outer membrane lipoprotein-sorting protein